MRLDIDDPANRITLRVMLEAEGHAVRDDDAAVVVCDSPVKAVLAAAHAPTLLLCAFSGVPEAVAAMRRGVFGYILLPFQPGEPGLMVERAAARGVPGPAPVESGDVPTLREVERAHVLAVLRRCGHNHSEAARLLGIGRNTLWRKLKQFGETPLA